MTTLRTATPPPRAAGNGAVRTVKAFGRTHGVTRKAHRILLYGVGGIGKSSLAAKAPSPIFADLERGSEDMDIPRVSGVENWADLRAWLTSGEFDGIETVVIDTATTAEEWCRQHVIATVKTEKGNTVTSLEGYGFGKGYTHLFEEWRRFLADLDGHYRAGRNVVLIAHAHIGKVPNPNGDDYIRNQPRLFVNNQVSLLHTTMEWCDHTLFVNYDVAAKDGKAKGSGTRTIYTTETATHLAKTRTLGEVPILFEKDTSELWTRLAGKAPADDIPA